MCRTHNSDAYLFLEHLIDMGQEYSLTFVSVIQSSVGLFWNLLVPGHSQSSSMLLAAPKIFMDPLPSQSGVCKLSASPSGFLSRASFSKCVASNLYSDKPGNNLLLVDHTDDGLKLAS